MVILLGFLLVLLYRRVMHDSRVKVAREEMPGKVSSKKNAREVFYFPSTNYAFFYTFFDLLNVFIK